VRGKPEPENEDQEMELLNECLEELHPHTRRAMELRYEQGHKPAEIAKRLGWTPESVYVVLSRARAALRNVSRARWMEGSAHE
jgi:RNA polymerase sigma-70 factor (ECF subfamily)